MGLLSLGLTDTNVDSDRIANQPCCVSPKRPGNINALTARIIERIKNLPWAEKFVLGGGLALAHYLEFRPTNDADCWWEENTPETEKEETLNTIAGWRDILERFPLPNHLAYHTLRALLHMPPVPGNLLELPYERFDTQENREDPCLLLV